MWRSMMVALFAGASALGALAQEVGPLWMPEPALEKAFSGKTIEGHYSDGLEFRERYDSDGGLYYKDDKRVQYGRWSLQAGTFCTIYDLDPSGGCYRVHKVGPNCFEFYFTARTTKEARSGDGGKPSWTARAWRLDKASTCPGALSV